MNPAMVTTGFDIPGCRVVKNIGIVRGIVVRSRSVAGTFLAGLQTLFGGNITIYTNLCEKARMDAYDLMCAHAEKHGANAVLMMRYDTAEMMTGVTEVLCYGTAVVVEGTQS
ncbi:MAG TPA: YbjQ family protein [Alphaproteobacteria bacterium]|nr:YbjQ family protein [Alphaproteobacteria bacterium]